MRLFLPITLSFLLVCNSLCSRANDKPLFVFVTSKYCSTCKELKPIIEELEYEYYGKVDFVKFDISSKKTIDHSKAKANELGILDKFNKYRSQIPHVGIICSNSKELNNFVGVTKKSTYTNSLNSLISNESCN